MVVKVQLISPNDIILQILQLSKDCDEISLNQLVEQTKLDPTNLKQNLSRSLEDFIELKDDTIHISKRVKRLLIKKAIQYGVALEDIIETLHWRDFEHFCQTVFDYNDFRTVQNFYFSHNKRRFEIDVIAIKEPLIFAIDAKKWKTGSAGALKTMVKNQITRVKALASALKILKIRQKLPLDQCKNTRLIPMLVTSKTYAIKIFQEVPILPFFKLNQFINDYHRYADLILHFPIKSAIQKTLF